jgi:hypothetical protein
MARLSNKGTTQRAPQTGASVPELPDFSPQLAELPGGQETNAAMQRWWDIVRQRIEFTDVGINGRMQTFTKTIGGITGTITVLEEITSDVEDYLESRYTLSVTAGAVATGITVFSRTGPDTNISYIAFQADRFLINTASGNKQIFSVSATEVLFGNVLTVNLANSQLYMGTGTYANANTYFYVDTVSGGRMSLGSKFVWDGSNLTLDGTITATAGSIGGWAINSTTISRNNAILDSAGQLILGTSNDIIYISAVDANYRLWVGDTTAASASFSVTKQGVMFSSGATIVGSITFASINRTLTTDNIIYLTWQGNSGLNVPGFYAQHETAAGGGVALLAVGTNANSAVFYTKARGSFGALTAVSTDDIIGGNSFQAYTGSTWTTLSATRSGITNSTGTPYYFINVGGVSATNYYWIFNYDGKLYFNDTFTPSNSFGSPYVSDALANIYRSAAGTVKTDGAFVVTGSLTAAAISGTTGGFSGTVTVTNANATIDVTNGTVTARSAINNGTSRYNWGTTSNHSIEIFTNNTSIWFFGSDGHFKAQAGKQIRSLAATGWTVPLYDDANTIEFQASGGQIFGRINGGAAILLG